MRHQYAYRVRNIADGAWSNAYRAPADAEPVWQHRMRISRTAGERAFAKDMVAEDEDG